MNTKENKKSRTALKALEKISGRKLTIGSLLGSIREGEEMTQVEFSSLLGVSKQYLCDLEHDRKTVSAKKAAEFAEKLGYPIAQFVRLALQEELDRYHIPLQVELHIMRELAA